MSVVVRVARPDEYDRVGELTVNAYRGLPVDHLWGGYDSHILDVESRVKHADVLVAVSDEGVIGAVTYVDDFESEWQEWTEPGEVQFRLLAVDAAARNQGAGEALVRACLERAGDRRVVIHTTHWMHAAQRMYERLGFERRPDRDVPYEHWNDPPVENLPEEWIGQSFLAYIRPASS